VENSCLRSGSYTYRISESPLSLSLSLLPPTLSELRARASARELRSRFPARLIILLAGNECLPRVISFCPALFTSSPSVRLPAPLPVISLRSFNVTNAQTSRAARWDLPIGLLEEEKKKKRGETKNACKNRVITLM